MWRRVLVTIGVGLVVLALASCGGPVTRCTPDESSCGSACVALYKDPRNCGACNTICAEGAVCSSGSCTTICGAGTTRCGQSCVDLTRDRENCGACGTRCGAGMVCQASASFQFRIACTSTCATGETLCVLDGGAAYCADTQSDAANCGACGNACDASRPYCFGGICSRGF